MKREKQYTKVSVWFWIDGDPLTGDIIVTVTVSSLNQWVYPGESPYHSFRPYAKYEATGTNRKCRRLIKDVIDKGGYVMYHYDDFLFDNSKEARIKFVKDNLYLDLGDEVVESTYCM